MFACGSKNEVQTAHTIGVEVGGAKEVRLDSSSRYQAMPLGEKGDVTLTRVKDIFVIDTGIYIYHGQAISAFDPKGNYTGNIGRVGRAGNEYVSLWYAWVEEGDIVIYDMNGKKLLTYSPGTKTLESKPVESEASVFFQALCPLGKSGYVAKRGFVDSPGGASPELAFFDKELEFQENIGELTLNSGLWLGRPFAVFGDEVLYWRQLGNDIFAIDKDRNLSVKYSVDFIKKNVPAGREFKDDYDKIEFVNADPNAYATFLSYVLETGGKVYFTFLFSGEKHLAVYDKKSGETDLYKFTFDGQEKLNNIVPLEQGVFVVTDMENGQSNLYILDL